MWDLSLCAVLVFFLIPKRADKPAMLARFQREDAALRVAVGGRDSSPPGAATVIGPHVPTSG